MSYHKGTATDYKDLLDKLVEFSTAIGLQSVDSIAAAGTGYVVGDILTLSGGTSVYKATLRVTTLGGGGAITGTKIVEAGAYSIAPADPVGHTGGTGTGATFNLTFASNGWTQVFTDTAGGEKQKILEGVGGGSAEIFVGIRTCSDAGGSGARNWELAGMTGFNVLSPYITQPGISPGRFDAPTSGERQGAYVPLSNGAIDFWFFVDGFRLVGICKIGSTYTNFYLGWINPAGTSSQYPYPLLALGSSSLWNQLYSASITNMSGLCDPVSNGASDVGPGLLRSPGGTWLTVANSGGAGGGRTKRQDLIIYPCGTPALAGLPSKDVALLTPLWDVIKVVPSEGSPGTVSLVVVQTATVPETRLFPTILIERSPDRQVLGELRGVRWVSAKGNVTNLTPEDEITVGVDVWLVFQNCNRTDQHAYVAVLEG